MRKRKLGRTGYEVSEVGFGAWGLGGGQWRGVDSRDAQRALHVALDSGIDFIDTALADGDGHAEKLIGEVIRDQRARDWAVVATKVPPLDGIWLRDGSTAIDRVFPAEYVVRSVEQSLRNLRAEVLCIAQLHVWHDAWIDSAAWRDLRGTMMQLIRAGKVLHWGVSSCPHDPDSVLRVIADPLIETVQASYNIYDRSCEKELFTRAGEHDVAVICRVPFDEGALTGTLTEETSFRPGDFRSQYFRAPRLAEAVERADALAGLVGSEVATLPELALRFCLSRPEPGVVIAGMRRVEHVRANISVSDGRSLSAEFLARLDEHAWDKNWYR